MAVMSSVVAIPPQFSRRGSLLKLAVRLLQLSVRFPCPVYRVLDPADKRTLTTSHHGISPGSNSAGNSGSPASNQFQRLLHACRGVPGSACLHRSGCLFSASAQTCSIWTLRTLNSEHRYIMQRMRRSFNFLPDCPHRSMVDIMTMDQCPKRALAPGTAPHRLGHCGSGCHQHPHFLIQVE